MQCRNTSLEGNTRHDDDVYASITEKTLLQAAILHPNQYRLGQLRSKEIQNVFTILINSPPIERERLREIIQWFLISLLYY